ncbi:LAMI_0H05204g1_1 [Lachancea mirantina]|uniref:Pre-mRNA-splicing factor CWC2 n=1 Tax=Lachancea mirantina TaxID=1230905 RepID=A0A1G4KEU5_9SACH|nr:LAMI_0H05204g1_1 [Lachancea mirantina]
MSQGSITQAKDWKRRAAPIQVKEADLPSSIPSQTGLTFNVWYNKWSQGNSGKERFVNPYRLEPELHEGYTRGDGVKQVFFCLYFGKGMCCLGKKCTYLHHVPEGEDVARLALKSNVRDCFGREKFADYREDMGGIGSFRKGNSTLYIGGIGGALNNKNLKASQIESRLHFMFGKLGPLERIRYVENKNCAFVRYRWQTSAEFAKEVMSNQTLLIRSDKEWQERREGTGLLVKWANDDPNPEAQQREKERQEEQSMQVMLQLLQKHEQDSALKRKLEEQQEEEDQNANHTGPTGHKLLENGKKGYTSIFDCIPKDSLKRLKKLNRDNPAFATVEKTPVPSQSGGLVDYSSSDSD